MHGSWDETHGRWTSADGRFYIVRSKPTPAGLMGFVGAGAWTVGRAIGGSVGQTTRFSQARAIVADLERGRTIRVV
jgi:hypothetical protein